MRMIHTCILTFLVGLFFLTNVHAIVDSNATIETKTLFQNLKSLQGKGTLFGHQNAEKEGHGWLRTGVSDVYKVSGKYPGVVGFDFKDVLQYYSTYFDFFLEKVKLAHEKVAVVTFSWHSYNPLTTRTFYDKTPAIDRILPGGDRHEYFKGRLDVIAKFAKRALDAEGNLIPIIFRPWHEHNHKWFWWGNSKKSGKAAEQEFINLWRFTVHYLRDVKDVHNFLYAYSPGRPNGSVKTKSYYYKYPGDNYVDIFGLDDYKKSTSEIVPWLRLMAQEADKKGKIAALTETGLEGITNHHYWTKDFLDPIKRDSLAKRMAYVMVWRNANENPDHFYAPFPGHPSVPDFMQMEADEFSLFADDWQDFIGSH